MKRIKIGRPSPALVIACIALFVALGGVGYAAATGSIDSRELKNNAVATKDLRNNSIVGKDVRRSTIAGPDVKNTRSRGRTSTSRRWARCRARGQADNAATAGSATSAGNATPSAGTREDVLTGHPGEHPHARRRSSRRRGFTAAGGV